MGLRFFRRTKLAPGLTLNFSKSGPSLSLGPRGSKVTVGPRGVRKTVGFPGTGLYYTTASGIGRSSRRNTTPVTSPVAKNNPLELGFFAKLTASAEEKALVEGLRELNNGNEGAALNALRRGAHLPDAAFLCGILCLKRKLWAEAETNLRFALEHERELGCHFRKYQVNASCTLPITEKVFAVIQPNARGVLLALAEVYQHTDQLDQAFERLNRLYLLDPSDVVIKLSRCELLVDTLQSEEALRQVIELAEGVRNESEIHASLLYFKGKALRLLGMNVAARDAFTTLLRQKSGRSEEFLRAVRYERALVYDATGEKSKARAEWEKLYAESPGYEDVAQRL
jgi:tetratricopeptide (TPR) repeat protein